MIKPTLHHVTIKTNRLDEMVRWYGAVIGAECNFRGEHLAWMTNDAANHRIALLGSPKLSDDKERRSHSGMHHTAFEYDTFDDLIDSYKRVAEKGIRPAFCLDHGLTCSMYYQDPDGNYVEIQSDNFGDWAKSTEFMRTSQDFATNPIGTPFDPERVHQAHKEGRSFAELQRGMRAGDFAPEGGFDLGMPVEDGAEAETAAAM